MRTSIRDNQSILGTYENNFTSKPQSEYDNISSTLRTTTTNNSNNLKVVVRVRPALPREMEEGLPFRSIALISNDNKSCSLVEYLGAELSERERQTEWIENPNLFQLHRFTYDYVFDMDASQEEVYLETAKPAVLSVLEGYNSTIFAYGQTGTGKTHTMEGFTYESNDELRGIVPRSIEEIFNYIETYSSSNTKFMVMASYLQIYNEFISDLLKPEKKNLQIREDKKKGVFVEGLSEWAVRSPHDIYTLLKRGAMSRATASTNMNDVSSRSHAVFVITVEQMTIQEDSKGEAITQIRVGKLNLVDLAGSERIRVTGATGKQLEESKKINKSLSALGNVIYALTDTKGRTHIPYRDSKLTRLLEDSLGGNCKTTMMTMISPAHESFNESLSSLHFARRAKNIKNRPVVNEDVNHRALIRQYEVELKRLRTELEEKNRQIMTNDVVIQLEEQKKQAEDDKKAAIYALEQASQQYLQEREEKKRLESKIQMMNSQMIVGGHKIEDTPQFRSALEERQTILLREFDQKLQEFEKERQQLEEDKAQVERYKQLLLKQRDIMIALTTKLNERDEAIVQLQEEVDAYDRINREQEEVIENKSTRIFALENLLNRNNIKIPQENNSNQNLQKDKAKPRSGEKVYIPYEAEKNVSDFEHTPMTLLSAEEKIRELKGIVSEQEKEIHILKILSQKFINSVYTEGGQVNLNELFKNLDKDYQFTQERNKLLRELQEKSEIINYQKQEIDVLTEQLNQNEKSYEKIEIENSKMLNIKDELLKGTDKLLKKLDSYSMSENIPTNLIRKDLLRMYQYLLEGGDNSKEIRTEQVGNNISNDDIEERANKSKRLSYITQNYEKFKQESSNQKSKGNQGDKNANNTHLMQNNISYTKTSPLNNYNKNNLKVGDKQNSTQQPVKQNPQTATKPVTPSDNITSSLGQLNLTKLKSGNFINKFINSAK